MIIAPTYADIFYTNAFNNGVVLVTLPSNHVDELFKRTEHIEGYELSVDLETMTITDNRQLRYPFEIDPFRRNRLLKGLDDIGSILEFSDALSAFEQNKNAIPPPQVTGSDDIGISEP